MQGMQQDIPEVARSTPFRRCSKSGCVKRQKSGGLCMKHWMQAWRAGEVEGRALCRVEDCAHFVESRGLCAAHYQRVRDGEAKTRCSIAGCERGARVRGYCRKHYSVARRSGDIDSESMNKCSVPTCNERTRGPFCQSHRRRNRLYDLTAEQMNALDIGTPCQVCGDRATDVDHCHATGKVRGFLCGPCNMAIGLFRDEPRLLKRAAEYLGQCNREAVREAQGART